MIREAIKSIHNYDIPVINNISGNEKSIVIISHGLGSSKESPTVKAVTERLAANGLGSISFDFPGHGESPVDGEYFGVENCLDDLGTVEAYASKLAPKADIMYFSSSFGAYINLIYIAERIQVKRKTFLRAAAVNMPGIFRQGETPELAALLESQGFFILDPEAHRPLKITKGLCQDLERKDVYQIYEKGMAEIAMIHGDSDESASFSDAMGFAIQSGASLTVVKGGKHRLMEQGQVKFMLDKAMNFYMSN
jgi:pimeloyl-ACP methyl ester carboxylesterase